MATRQFDKNTYISSNSYTKGLSFDLDKLKISQEVYVNGENIRLESTDGDMLAITNVKGERFEFSVPNIYSIYKIDIDYLAAAGTQTFGINGHVVPITISSNDTNTIIVNQLKSNLSINADITAGLYDIQYNSNYIVVVSLDLNLSIPTVVTGTGISITTQVPAQSNLKIIGWIWIRDTIVMFTTNSSNPNPSSYGQIWKFKYDETTNQVEDVDINGFLVISKHLIYNEKLDFSRFNRVSGEGRYESTNKQSVYFTDNHNNLRTFNIVKENSFATPPEIIQVNPLNQKNIPIITNIQDGGFIPNGVIQYFYQLVTQEGIETFFSNPSEMISLTNSPLSSTFQNYQGGDIDVVSGKAVSIQINGIDLRYSIIRVGYIHYPSKDLANISIFYEGFVPQSGTLNLTHSYNETLDLPIEQGLYNLVANPFDICKGLETKKNILFAYNLKERNFDVDFDARAYRFTNVNDTFYLPRHSILFQENESNAKVIIDGTNPTAGTTINYTNSGQSWTDIPETDDVINPYNFEDPNLNVYGGTPGGDWYVGRQYAFQTDGITLGGEGPNIKYKFINSPQEYGDIFQGSVTGYPFVSDYSQSGAKTFSSMKNPLNSMNYYGHARGEVYRYGIVFFDLSGRPSFVKWIGDIKFPQYSNKYATNPNEFELFSNAKIIQNTTPNPQPFELYGLFQITNFFNSSLVPGNYYTINGSSNIIYNPNLNNPHGLVTGSVINISGMVGQGATANNMTGLVGSDFIVTVIDNYTFSISPFITSNFNGIAAPSNTQPGFWTVVSIPSFVSYPNGEYIFTQQVGIEFTLDTTTPAFQEIKDKISGWTYVRMERTFKDKTRLGTGLINAIRSSFVNSNTTYWTNSSRANSWLGYNHDSASIIKTDSVLFENMSFKFDVDYNFVGGDYLKVINYSATNDGTGNIYLTGQFENSGWYEKQYINAASIYPNNNSRNPINNLYNIPEANTKSVVSIGGGGNFANVSEYDSTDDAWHGLGGKTTVLDCALFNNNTLSFSTNSSPYPKNTNNLINSNGKYKIIASYERYLATQYGGPSYTARQGQEYITCGQFIEYNSNILSTIVTPVFSGDVYTMVTDFVKIEKNWGNQGWEDNDNDYLQGQIFPAEVHANIHLRQGYHFANKQYPTPVGSGSGGPYDDGSNLFDEYKLNTVYNQQNNTKKYFSRPFNYNPILERPHRIHASQQKFDGENVNAWMIYKTTDFIDLEGTYGPLNRVILKGDKMLAYQDYALATVDVLEKQTVSGDAGEATIIGVGTVLQRYDYISKETGSKHQFGVIKTPNGVYHYDSSIRKIFRIGEGLQALTDVKGISVWANKNLLYEIKERDRTLASRPVGVTTGYNPRFNQVYFTFYDYKSNDETSGKAYTLVYNELLDIWESFLYPNLNIAPGLYMNTETRFISVPNNLTNSGITLNKVYLHNEGEYNKYFDTLQASKFSVIVNGEQFTKMNKRFDIIEFVVEAFNASGTYLPTETISNIFVSNDYQQTPLLNSTDLIKRFKVFRLNNLRDNTIGEPRLRDMYIKIDITYTNPNNNKLVIHDIDTYFVPQRL